MGIHVTMVSHTLSPNGSVKNHIFELVSIGMTTAQKPDESGLDISTKFVLSRVEANGPENRKFNLGLAELLYTVILWYLGQSRPHFC